jgi:hypothetical protein
MATRRLTIAGLAGGFRIRFTSPYVNLDTQFTAICGGSIKVDRSNDGTAYYVESTVDHFRVFINLEGPDQKLPAVYTHGCSNYGWWQIDGYPKVDFEVSGGGSIGPSFTANKMVEDPSFGVTGQVDPW